MDIKTILFSTQGTISRKEFWITILSLHLIYRLIDYAGNNLFDSYEPTRISFMMFFISQMIPRFFGIFVLLSTFFIAKKRNNEIGRFGWIPLFYVITLFLPTYVDAVSDNQNIVLFMGIIPLLITFYLGLASPSPKN